MNAAIVHRMSNEFDDRNRFLQTALGLVSVCRRLRTHLHRVAPAVATRHERLDRDAEAILYFLLGLVSVTETVMTHLGRAEARRRTRRPATARSRAIVPRDLLR
jgi:hypothetical protein